MGKPSSPTPADPVVTAQAQTASNRETAIAQTGLNAINQTTPQGTLSYSQNGTWADGTPRFSSTTTLSPEQQQLYNTGVSTQQNLANLGNRQSQTIGNVLSSQFNTDGLPAAVTSIGKDYSADRQKVEDALMARLNPQIERDRAAQEASLANRGVRLGSNNYADAQDTFGRTVNDARLGVIGQAGNEQTRMQGLDLNAANFANGARNQAINERLTTRNQALNENIGLATGSQVSMPTFGSTPSTGIGGTDVGGITANANNANQASYNAQLGQWNSTAGGLFGLGANALMAFSDKRLKTDIEPTGETVAGVPVKSWTWKGTDQRETGVIAQELEKKHPALVDNSHPSGMKRVNYGALMQLGATAKRAA